MPLILTDSLPPDAPIDQVYNGLDCCVTYEVLTALQELLHPAAALIYGFERALQAPLLEMMLRGIRVDELERRENVRKLRASLERLDIAPDRRETTAQADRRRRDSNGVLQHLARAVWDRPLNPNSPKQLQEFFYGHMKLPEVWISEKGQRKLSMRREVLEKLEAYFHARPLIATLLAISDLSKKLETCEMGVDPDGRMRTFFYAATNTGRLSSSASATGSGGNLQNITEELRKMFVADSGWVLVNIDLEQADSRAIGYECGLRLGDWSYLDACESGDLHTFVATLVWPKLGWTGDPATDRALAERPFYRHFDYRFMCKKGGHGSNYYGKPYTIARHMKVPQKLVETFQQSYFSAFPCIPRLHQWVSAELARCRELTTHLGRHRIFFGRPEADETLREAVAFLGQSPTADRTDLGLWRIWKRMPQVQLLLQLHDAVLFQCREEDLTWAVPQAIELMRVELRSPSGRRFTIPGGAKVGWNWADYEPRLNPDGLRKWRPGGGETRRRASGLDRVL